MNVMPIKKFNTDFFFSAKSNPKNSERKKNRKNIEKRKGKK